MSDTIRTAVTRTITLSDLTPAEVASIFSNWTDQEQAAFFNALAGEVKDWPGTGWCMQCSYITQKLDDGGRRIVEKLAEWLA